MSEFIEKQAAIYAVGLNTWAGSRISQLQTVDVDSLNAKHEDIGYEKGYRDGYAEALEETDNAEPVKHGYWIMKPNGYGTCSNCKRCSLDILGGVDSNYCPNCGARMDGVKDEIS